MKNERGTSLIELLLVIAIIGSVVFLISNIPNSLMLISKSRHVSLAREIVSKSIEDKRTITYANITTGITSITDPRLSQLPQGSGTITVGIEATPDNWINCSPSICPNGEEIKQIMVTVDWVDNDKPQSLILQTIIGEGGINQ